MLDTVLLCGNTGYDDEHKQPTGPEVTHVAEQQWLWLEKQLKNSRFDIILCLYFQQHEY